MGNERFINGNAANVHMSEERYEELQAQHPDADAMFGIVPCVFLTENGVRYDEEVQAFVDHGYAVASINYRGSTGYGQAFADGVYQRGAVAMHVSRGVGTTFVPLRLFARPDKVHRVDHDGPNYRMSAVHMCEPSPQRTPVLYQAGASTRGRMASA